MFPPHKEAIVCAYYSGIPAHTGYILVHTTHHHIDTGSGVPNLDDYLFGLTNVVQTLTTHDFIIFAMNTILQIPVWNSLSSAEVLTERN